MLRATAHCQGLLAEEGAKTPFFYLISLRRPKLQFSHNCAIIASMKLEKKVEITLDKKFQNVLKTPAGFDFFMAIHDFIGYIESNLSLSSSLSNRIKSNRELKIPSKYDSLKQIYQGVEDSKAKSKTDIGHTRYMTIIELNKIRNKDFSENNSFWKKRELFRKSASEIYEKLNPNSA